jgi:hypothetical protein
MRVIHGESRINYYQLLIDNVLHHCCPALLVGVRSSSSTSLLWARLLSAIVWSSSAALHISSGSCTNSVSTTPRRKIEVAIFLLERTNLRPENVNLTFLPFETPGKAASNRRRYPADHSSGHRFPLVDWRPRANNTAFPDWSNAPGRKKIIVPVANAWPRALVLRGHNPAGTGARRTSLMRTCRPER